MKDCPKCRAVYTNDFIYCDQDGAPLRARSAKALWIILGLLILLLVAAGLAAEPLLEAFVMSKISVSAVDASLHVDSSNKLSTLESISANIVVRVRNESTVSPTLRTVKLNCSASGQKFAEIVWPQADEQPVSLPAGGARNVNVRLQARGSSGLDLILLAARNTLTADCDGNAEVSVFGYHLAKNIRFEEKLW